jgi:hypothetical protein
VQEGFQILYLFLLGIFWIKKGLGINLHVLITYRLRARIDLLVLLEVHLGLCLSFRRRLVHDAVVECGAFPRGFLLLNFRCLLRLVGFFLHFFLALLLIFLVVVDQREDREVIDLVRENYVDGVHQLRLNTHPILATTDFGQLLQSLNQWPFEPEVE